MLFSLVGNFVVNWIWRLTDSSSWRIGFLGRVVYVVVIIKNAERGIDLSASEQWMRTTATINSGRSTATQQQRVPSRPDDHRHWSVVSSPTTVPCAEAFPYCTRPLWKDTAYNRLGPMLTRRSIKTQTMSTLLTHALWQSWMTVCPDFTL